MNICDDVTPEATIKERMNQQRDLRLHTVRYYENARRVVSNPLPMEQPIPSLSQLNPTLQKTLGDVKNLLSAFAICDKQLNIKSKYLRKCQSTQEYMNETKAAFQQAWQYEETKKVKRKQQLIENCDTSIVEEVSKNEVLRVVKPPGKLIISSIATSWLPEINLGRLNCFSRNKTSLIHTDVEPFEISNSHRMNNLLWFPLGPDSSAKYGKPQKNKYQRNPLSLTKLKFKNKIRKHNQNYMRIEKLMCQES